MCKSGSAVPRKCDGMCNFDRFCHIVRWVQISNFILTGSVYEYLFPHSLANSMFSNFVILTNMIDVKWWPNPVLVSSSILLTTTDKVMLNPVFPSPHIPNGSHSYICYQTRKLTNLQTWCGFHQFCRYLLFCWEWEGARNTYVQLGDILSHVQIHKITSMLGTHSCAIPHKGTCSCSPFVVSQFPSPHWNSSPL